MTVDPIQPTTPVVLRLEKTAEGFDHLPPSTVVNGTVMETTDEGMVLLQTEHGPLTIKAPLALKAGDRIAFAIVDNSETLSVKLLTVNGQAVELLSHAGLKTATGLGSAPHHATALATHLVASHDSVDPLPLTVTPGTLLTTTLQTAIAKTLNPFIAAYPTEVSHVQHKPHHGTHNGSPAHGESPISAPKVTVPTGSKLVFEVMQIEVKHAGQTVKQPAIPPLVYSASTTQLLHRPQLSSAQGHTDHASQAPKPTLNPWVQGHAEEPLDHAPTPMAAPTSPLLKGTVVAMTDDPHSTFIHTSIGWLEADIALPSGSQMTLKLRDIPLLAPQAMPDEAPHMPLIARLREHWGSMENVVQQMLEVPIPAGSAPSTQRPSGVPIRTEHFAEDMHLYLHLFQYGKGGALMHASTGAKLTTEEEQCLDEIYQMAEYFRRMSSDEEAAPTHTPHGWKAVLLPLLHQQAYQQAMLYVRHHPHATEKTVEENAIRFVVECSSLALGALQLDGLFCKKQPGTFPALYLILRSHIPLPAPLQDGIVEQLKAVVQTTMIRATLEFQTMPHFPVQPAMECFGEHLGEWLV